MKGHVIPLRSAEHEELWDLLPWYVTGRLEPEERARVEGHLATCAECQAEVRMQRRLEAEVARLPLDVDEGWARMKAQMAREPKRRRQAPPWLGWSVAAALALVVGITLAPRQETAGQYRTLSAAAAPKTGNLVVIFRPETTERQMREMLTSAQARLVDGPTAADGYVLQAPQAKRAAILAMLRSRPEVVLAEPLDEAKTP